MKITQKAANLLRDEFTFGGKVHCSAIHTCAGTAPLWGQLVLAEMVKEIPVCLGHPFNYELTEKGRSTLSPKWWEHAVSVPIGLKADIDRNAGYDEDDETPDERKRRIEIEKGEIARDIEKDDL